MGEDERETLDHVLVNGHRYKFSGAFMEAANLIMTGITLEETSPETAQHARSQAQRFVDAMPIWLLEDISEICAELKTKVEAERERRTA